MVWFLSDRDCSNEAINSTLATGATSQNNQVTNVIEIGIRSCNQCSKKYANKETNDVTIQDVDDEWNCAIKQIEEFTYINETNVKELKTDKGTEMERLMILGTDTMVVAQIDRVKKIMMI